MRVDFTSSRDNEWLMLATFFIFTHASIRLNTDIDYGFSPHEFNEHARRLRGAVLATISLYFRHHQYGRSQNVSTGEGKARLSPRSGPPAIPFLYMSLYIINSAKDCRSLYAVTHTYRMLEFHITERICDRFTSASANYCCAPAALYSLSHHFIIFILV